MQVSIETTSGLERRISVAVPANILDEKVNQKIAEVAKTARINGFRKGKVPLKVVKKQYGTAIKQEVAGDLINSSYPEALEKESVNPAGQPQIEIKTLEFGQDFEFTAIVEVYPEVELAELSGFAITKYNSSVETSDVDSMIDRLREQKATFTAVEREVADGDQVTIDFVGTRDGEKFEGGSGSDHKLVIGSNSMIPGFESGIVGMKAGEEKVLPLTFPEDYHAEDLKGAAVEFAVTVKSVEEKSLPELDEEFFKGFDADNLDALKEKITENMERELKRALTEKVKGSVMEELIKAHEVEAPKALVAADIKTLREQMMQQFGGMANQSMDIESLLPDQMFTEKAERRVKLGLILGEIVKKNEIKADEKRVNDYIGELSASYESPEEFINYYKQNPQMMASVESVIVEEMVVDMILEKSTVTEETVDYETAVANSGQN